MGKPMSGRFRRQKRKKPIRQDGLFTCLMPGSSLLSHGETPHYHILCAQYAILYRISCVARARKVSHIPQYAPSFPSLVALLLRKLLRT